MSTDVLGIDALLISTLAGDPTLAGLIGNRVYSDVAPDGAVFPFVVYSLAAAPTVRGVGAAHIMSNATYTVKAVDDSATYATLRVIADRIDALLIGLEGANDYGTVLAGTKEETIRFTILEAGRQYRHLGGQYRFHSH